MNIPESTSHFMRNTLNNVRSEFNQMTGDIKNTMLNETKQHLEKIPKPDRMTSSAERKIYESLNEFIEALPIIEKAGYSFTQMEVELGLPPRIVPRFCVLRYATEEEQKELLKETKSRFIQVLLQALFKSNTITQHIKVKHLRFAELAIHITTLPKVSIRFVNPNFHTSFEQPKAPCPPPPTVPRTEG